jgi:predicted dehydrogenase
VYPCRKLRDLRLVGVASSSAEAARALAATYRLPRAYASFEALLADPSVHAVYIAAPVLRRPELVTAALLAGRHVLCEPPIAPNAHQARDAVVLAAQMRRSLVEAVPLRHHPLTERVRDLVHANTLGSLRHVTITLRLPWWAAPRAGDARLRYDEGGGAALHLGHVAVQWLRGVLGAEPEVVAAKARVLDSEPQYARGAGA